MPPITASELDLLTFFEAEPHRADPDGPWIYNDLAYTFSDGRLQISFAVAPSYKDVRIILREGERIIYELNSMDVDDVEYMSDGFGGNESVRVTLVARDTITIRLKPHIVISHDLASQV